MSILPSITSSLSTLMYEKKAKGEKVYNFAEGDIVLPNHPSILEGANKALEKKFILYPPMFGIVELRKAALEWVRVYFDSHYSLENVIVTPGGKFAIFAALKTILEPEDEVLILVPYWVSYPEIVSLCGAKPVIILGKWKVTPKDLEKKVTSKTKALILNNACNPTGVLYSQEEIKALVEFAKKNNLMILSDEVYSHIVYEKKKFFSCGAFQDDNIIVIQSCSKNFGMSGWRVGFAFAKDEIISKMGAFMSQTTTGVALPSQYAALGALENIDAVTQYILKSLMMRRELFFNVLDFFTKPDSSVYAFLPINEKSSETFCKNLLNRINIALVPGKAFGMEGYVRAAFSQNIEEFEEGLNILKDALL
ncbi:MAG: pyridoxal phosphate-dependent aminotransferase [Chlamydiae bacterium]|nr:pyridoxal phosphate-dependent aminotransferase [Chlamydiota bacterium]